MSLGGGLAHGGAAQAHDALDEREIVERSVALGRVLPTFFDVRNTIARDAVKALTDHFGERCLPPIRVNTKLREAPSCKQTIFEHAPESHGALDYLALVERIVRLRGTAMSEAAAQAHAG